MTTKEEEFNSSLGKRELLYKVVVVGASGTGKTSIIHRYLGHLFSIHYKLTVGIDYFPKVIELDDTTVVRLQLWDIAGQDHFTHMSRVYYKHAVGGIIVFDLLRKSSFEAVEKWKQDLEKNSCLPDGSPLPCVLMANKCDCSHGDPVVDDVMLQSLCDRLGILAYFKTSAKDNINITEAVMCLVHKVVELDKKIKFEDEDRVQPCRSVQLRFDMKDDRKFIPNCCK